MSKRGVFDAATPELALEDLADEDVVVWWDAVTKTGGRVQAGILRTFLGGAGGAPAAHAASHATGGADPITPASIGAATVAEAGDALTAAQNAQTTADDAATAATAAQGTADNAVTAAGVAQGAADAAGMAADTAQVTANAAAVRLTPQVVISASRALTDDDAGKILICDTSAGAIALTAPQTLAAEWNAAVAREGANAATITGTGTMVMVGPAAAAGVVTIGVDDGMVTLVRRSASRCLAYGVVS